MQYNKCGVTMQERQWVVVEWASRKNWINSGNN